MKWPYLDAQIASEAHRLVQAVQNFIDGGLETTPEA